MFPLPAFVPVQVCSVVSACRGISQLHPQIPSQSLIKHIIQHNTELTFCIIRSLCIILCTLIIWRKPAVERRPGSSLEANHPTHQYHHQQLDLLVFDPFRFSTLLRFRPSPLRRPLGPLGPCCKQHGDIRAQLHSQYYPVVSPVSR